MKPIWSGLALIVLISLLSGCEREVDLDLRSLPPELVVLANFSDMDTMEVVVSKTWPVLEKEKVTYVSDAAIGLYIDGFYAENLEFKPSSVLHIPGYYLSGHVIPEPGRHYRITVDVPGFDPLAAECTMPFPVEIDTGFTSLLIEKSEMDEVFNLATFTVKIKVQDPEPAANYYHLNFYQEGYDITVTPWGDTVRDLFYSLPLVMSSNDEDISLIPYIEDRGALFSDEALDKTGGELSFTSAFQYRRSDQEIGDFIIELRSVAPEYYFYHRSLARQYKAGQDPFSEPVILYTNVGNGHGVFAGFIPRFYRVDTGK